MIDRFDEKLELIEAEKELLFGCSTNKGFIQRLVTKFLPKLRNDGLVGPLIQEWEKSELSVESSKKKAYKELSLAFKQVKEVLKHLEENGIKVFPNRDSKITVCESILSDICSENTFFSCREPPYTRVYHKIRGLYVNHISKSHEVEFAPTALDLIEKDKKLNFLVSTDCDPAFLWRQLTLLESAWSVAGNKHSIGWGKIPADEKMWLSADAAFRAAFRNYMANELWNSDNPLCRKEFFQRSRIESLIDRILKEISLILAEGSDLKTREKQKHWRTRKKDEDVQALIPFAKKIWEKEFPSCSDPVHMSPGKLAGELLDNLSSTVSLHSKGRSRFPRAQAAIEITDPRIFKGGRYLGPKSHWQRFDWVKAF